MLLLGFAGAFGLASTFGFAASFGAVEAFTLAGFAVVAGALRVLRCACGTDGLSESLLKGSGRSLVIYG